MNASHSVSACCTYFIMSLTAFGTLNVREKSPIFFSRPLLITHYNISYASPGNEKILVMESVANIRVFSSRTILLYSALV